MHTRVQSDYIVKLQGNSIPFDEYTHPESASIIQAFHVGRQCFWARELPELFYQRLTI